MNNEELSRFLQDLTYTHRQVEAVLAQGYSINAFWAGFIVALLLCIALFFLIRYIERNGEKATLFAKCRLAVEHGNAYRQDYFGAQRQLDNMTGLVEQTRNFLKDMGPRFGHEAEQQRLINECESSLQGSEPEPEIMPHVQEERGDRAVAFLTALRDRHGAKQ